MIISRINKVKIQLSILLICIVLQSCNTENRIIWQIGASDNSSAEFSLAPYEYDQFLENDFGWEDRFFLVGSSSLKKDWPMLIWETKTRVRWAPGILWLHWDYSKPMAVAVLIRFMKLAVHFMKRLKLTWVDDMVVVINVLLKQQTLHDSIYTFNKQYWMERFSKSLNFLQENY